MSAQEALLNILSPLAPFFRRERNAVNDPSLVRVGVTEYETSLESPVAIEANGAVLDYDVPAQYRHWRVALTAFTFTITAANDFGGKAFVTLPDTNLVIFGAELNGDFTFGGDYAANDDVVIGIGTAAAAANPVATTAVDVLPATNLTNITVTTPVEVAAASRAAAVGAAVGLYIPDAAANQLFLNASSTDTQLAADGTVTFTGYVDIFALDLGNRGS